jgi:4-amino-4-deoxy-L-arabinose transferase-like glycosyltransferase
MKLMTDEPVLSAASERWAGRKTISVCSATLLAAAVLLPLLGRKVLASRDEAIYAEVAREFLGHNWLVPMWHFHPWPEKPPLAIWVTACLFHLFGVTNFWARAVSALSGVGIVAVVHALAGRLRGVGAAWLSTAMLLTIPGFLHVCVRGEMDAPLTFACCLALWGLVKVREGRLAGWYLFWTAFAAAAMVKGAASITLLLTLIVVMAWSRWGWKSLGRPFALGLLIFLALVLPWHVYMLHVFGMGFLREYLGFHVMQRATSPWGGRATPPWYYVTAMVAYASPWVVLFPFALVRAAGRRALRETFVFAMVVLVTFSAMATRAPRYVFPAYPALVWMSADWVAAWLATRSRRVWVGFAVGAAALCGLAVPLTKHLRSRLGGAAGNVITDRSDREAPGLLMLGLKQAGPVADPVLLWQQDVAMQEMPTLLFYGRRPMQQVYLGMMPDTLGEAKRYSDPEPLRDYVDQQPHLILMEKRLAGEIPSGMEFREIASGKTLEVGVVRAAGR